jgi:predicted MFS family arabinose efflux permease
MNEDLRMNERWDRSTVVVAFGAFGVFWGAWGATLPQIQHSARVTSATLGLDILFIGLGALASMRLTGSLIDRLGPLVLPGSMAALAFAGVLPALARSGATLGAAMFAVGATSGAFDVAANTAGARSEATCGRPIMNLGHAGFSIGVVIVSLSSGGALDQGATPLGVLTGVGVTILAAAAALTVLRQATAWGQAMTLPKSGSGPRAPGRARGVHWQLPRIPSSLLTLGAICGMAYVIEGCWQSWGALHIERTFHGSPALGAAAPAAFAIAAALGRLMGQRVVDRVGPRHMLQRGAVLAAAGSLLAAVAPTAGWSLAGVAVAGLGTSICAPTVFSLTGQVADPANRGAATGTVTTLAYIGFVVGPSLMGVLISAFGLRTALGTLLFIAAALGILGGRAPVPGTDAALPPGPLTAR